jgi:hypothetical protein
MEFSPILAQEPAAVLAEFASAGWWLRTRRSKLSHKCSIGFKSGNLDGQGSTYRSGWLESQK